MPKQQAPFTWESFEASTRAEYGWSDRLPTLDDLPGMLKDLADEIELGDTPRLKHLVTKVQYAARIVDPITSKDEHRRRNGDQVKVTKYRNGQITAIVHRADGTTSTRSHGLHKAAEADQLCSDLEIISRLCFDLLLTGVPDPATTLTTKLRKLSERIEAKVPPDDEEWPKPGWTRADNVMTADGKKVPRSTVQGWAEAEKEEPEVDTGPGGATAYRNEWIAKHLDTYNRKPV